MLIQKNEPNFQGYFPNKVVAPLNNLRVSVRFYDVEGEGNFCPEIAKLLYIMGLGGPHALIVFDPDYGSHRDYRIIQLLAA